MATGKQQVMVRPTSDPDVLEYHTLKKQICELAFADFFQPIGTDAEEMFSGLGPIGKKIATRLMGQPEEIDKISFLPESIRVRKTPQVSWSAADKVISQALRQALGVRQLEFIPYSEYLRTVQPASRSRQPARA
jgi:hypothetical protein